MQNYDVLKKLNFNLLTPREFFVGGGGGGVSWQNIWYHVAAFVMPFLI